MRWDDRIIAESELSRYLKDQDNPSLAALMDALIEQQRETWPMLKSGCDSLSEIETKRVAVAESSIVVQHNPKRIRSTAASVDKASVAERKCFLCAENLPAEEKGIRYGDQLVILCNPFPVLGRHLSIVHRDHVEQRIQGNIETLLEMARDFGPEYFVLYNGPECGASAPDHLHFQACSRRLLPIEDDARGDELNLVDDCASCEETARQSFEVFTLSGCGRGVIVFRGGDDTEISNWVYRVLDELSRASAKSEPMVNVICTYVAGLWSVYLFPRARHRPSCFFAEGDNQLLVSPGAIDMAGVIVVPRHTDFQRIDRKHIESVFSEVSYDQSYINELVERACASVEEEAW